MLDSRLQQAIDDHTLHDILLDSSTGPTTEYRDVVSAILSNPRGFRTWYLDALQGLHPVGPGASGALIIGLLGYGSIWRGDKGYGPVWHALPPPQTRVALVDDSAFSGVTLSRLWQACEAAHLRVEKEIVAYDARLLVPHHAPAD